MISSARSRCLVEALPVRLQPAKVLAGQQRCALQGRGGADLLQCRRVPLLLEQLLCRPDAGGGPADVEVDALGKRVPGRCGFDQPLFAEPDRGGCGADRGDDAAQRDRPRGGWLVAPDHRRESFGGDGLFGESQGDEGDPATTTAECVARDQAVTVAHADRTEQLHQRRLCGHRPLRRRVR